MKMLFVIFFFISVQCFADTTDEINLEINRLEYLVNVSKKQANDLMLQVREYEKTIHNLRNLVNSNTYRGSANFHISYIEHVAWACTDADANVSRDPVKESGYSSANRVARDSAALDAVNDCQSRTGQKCKGTGVFTYSSQYLSCTVSTQALPARR